MSEQKVLRRLKQTILRDFLVVNLLFLKAKFRLSLQAGQEEGEECLLVFSVEGVRVGVVNFQEICLHTAVSQLVVLNLRERLECKVDIGHVVDVQDFHHACCALIDGVPLTGQECSLLHLLLANLGLEADPVKPVAGHESDFGNAFVLPIVELTEECFFNRV